MKRILIFFFFFFSVTSTLFPQEKVSKVQRFTFEEYLQQVFLYNLEFIYEKYEVSAAEASLLAAKVFKDPELEMLTPRFKQEEFSGFPANIEYELTVPVELFGKRRYRIEQAQAERFVAEANLQDFLRRLRMEAANNFVETLKEQLLLERMRSFLDQWQDYYAEKGAGEDGSRTAKIDSLQVLIQTRTFKAAILDRKAALEDRKAETYILFGGIPADSLVFSGDLIPDIMVPDITVLLELLKNNRPDLVAASREVKAAEFAVEKARANRLPDISLIVGYANEEAISPMPVNAFFGGVIIPLKFSGLNPGKFRESLSRLEQSEISLELDLLRAEAELLVSWEKFKLLEEKRLIFSEAIVQDAQNSRRLTLEAYRQGEIPLLSVLESERTLISVFEDYYETLVSYIKAVIDLSGKSGSWFVNFSD